MVKIVYIGLQLITFQLQVLNGYVYSKSRPFPSRKQNLKSNRSLEAIQATSAVNYGDDDRKHHNFKFQLDVTKVAKAVQNILPKRFHTVISIIIWYCVASLSNVSNKKMIELLHGFPLIAGTIQMSMCALLILIYWAIFPSSNPYRNQTLSIKRKQTLNHTNETTKFGIFETVTGNIKNFVDQFNSPLRSTSAFYGFSQLSTLYALNYGSLSFTQLIKAAEPFFHSVFGKVLHNSSISLLSYVSLLPILIGVSLLVRSASRSNHHFTFPWMSLVFGVLSNLFAVMREINIKKYDLLLNSPSTNITVSKNHSKKYNSSIQTSIVITNSESDKNTTSTTLNMQHRTLPPLEQNTLYSVFMLQSLRVLLPLALIIEGPRFYAMMRKLPSLRVLSETSSVLSGKVILDIISTIFTSSSYQIMIGLLVAVISGILFCVNTHLAMSVLKEASPVTRAFANFMKRVVILFVSLFFFRRMTDDSWDWTDITSIFSILAEGDIDLDFDFLDLDFD